MLAVQPPDLTLRPAISRTKEENEKYEGICRDVLDAIIGHDPEWVHPLRPTLTNLLRKRFKAQNQNALLQEIQSIKTETQKALSQEWPRFSSQEKQAIQQRFSKIEDLGEFNGLLDDLIN